MIAQAIIDIASGDGVSRCITPKILLADAIEIFHFDAAVGLLSTGCILTIRQSSELLPRHGNSFAGPGKAVPPADAKPQMNMPSRRTVKLGDGCHGATRIVSIVLGER